MPLSRLENFLINTEGNILYVNPNDLDSTDSFDNKGNSLTRPFKTIQRALIESARFAYQSGRNNDKFDKTTILLYPGTHTIDNRPGLSIKSVSSAAKYYDFAGSDVTASTDLELKSSTVFDLNNANNVLYKFNSIEGGVIIPKGTSLVGMDLRKTKIRPLYVPDPTKNTPTASDFIPRSAVFRVTGGCYFWQFSLFDANQSVYFNKTTQKTNPSISHHKLTCFEYADGLSVDDNTGYTDLQMYYYKLMNAYGQNTGVRNITAFPTAVDFEPNTPEFKIVGDLVANDNSIISLTATGSLIQVGTQKNHGLNTDDSVRIAGIANSTFYEGSYKVAGVGSDRSFNYYLPSTPNELTPAVTSAAKVVIEADNVDGSSPYVFNVSLRSVYGMCGLHADGAKATGFKSMVVAQFTGIGLQKDDNAFILYDSSTGRYNGKDSVTDSTQLPLYINQNAVFKPAYENFHIKASNDAVIQAVSTFAIGFAAQFLSESGGEQSITNSNSNFGSKALLSHGFRKDAFDRDDSGYVTHIIPPTDLQEDTFNVIWRTIDPTLTLTTGDTRRLYILEAKDQENPPSNISNGFRVGSKTDDKLYLDVVIGGDSKSYSAPILMEAGANGVISNTVEGPTGEKRHKVARTNSGGNNINVGTDVISLEGVHDFITGESVRVHSDNCNVPDGMKNGKLYYVISVSTTTIKLASTFNKSKLASPEAISIKNQDGGVLTITSSVTDKSPGEIGHPIQWDSTKNNWYIRTSSTNTLYGSGFVGFSTQIEANNSTTYVQRLSEGRDLDSRIYRLRYVIPKEVTESGAIAKKPEKNYTLQESKTVDERTTITTVNSNRNPRVISGITSTVGTNGSIVTVTSELPHKLSIGDGIRVKNAFSTRNIAGVGATGYNGYFEVTSVPTTKAFTYTNTKSAGTYLDKLKYNRNDIGGTGIGYTLATFERTEYDTTYTIQDVETVQEYENLAQDGIYHLTCLIGNIKPTVEPFDNLKFKQDIGKLYPTVDKDNPNNDPLESVSSAVNDEIGKVDSNNPKNSLSKEVTINYLKDNRIGIGLTGAISDIGTSGIVTAFSDTAHNLSGIVTFTLSAAGSGYVTGAGVTTLYNLPLYNNSSTYAGDGATGNFVVNNSGTVTAFELVDSGSAYAVGNVLKVGSGNATVTVSKINDAVGKAAQVVGVGTTANRNDSPYNGLFKITGISSCKSISYNAGVNPGAYAGISTLPQGMIYALDEVVPISTIVGTAGTTLAGIVTATTSKAHGLIAGNKIKISGVTGGDAANFNSDFIVKEKVGLTTFTFKASTGIGTDQLTTAEVYKYGLGALGQSQSFELENIAGSFLPLNAGISTTMSAAINVSATSLVITNYLGFDKGDFLQIDNEIVRVTARSIANSTTLTVIRGVLGTRATTHDDGSIVRKIKVIPSQTHRYSSIRASGHTFEYVGYGPGNYSTALPTKQVRSLTDDEESLALSREEKGGIVFFSGMNDRGDYFTGDRVTPRENFLGEIGSDASGVFDDLYVRNTLRVGGGANRNLPSDFRGPVNFGNKITSTAADGIEAIKLLLKGTATQNPSFMVGDETSPSFVVKEDTQRVGIQTADPQYELDVNGTIRANAYNNFELTDLPTTLEPTFLRNRVLMVKSDESGYELVDSHELPAFELRSYGVSNDPTIYVGAGSTNPAVAMTISGISTAKFYVGEKVKVFGATVKGVADAADISDPVLDTSVSVERAGTGGGAPYSKTYYYWISEFNERNGRIGISSQISPDGGYTGAVSTKRAGIGHTDLDKWNSSDFIRLKLRRSSIDNGIAVYRQEYNGVGAASNADITSSRLVAILGEKQLKGLTSGIVWADYGVFEQTEWSPKSAKNEYVGSATTDGVKEQIHFPCIGTTGAKRGWNIDEVVSIGSGTLTLADSYYTNQAVSFGSTTVVKLVHDNTSSLKVAIDKTVASGGNYLTLPSGTYLANRIVVPDSFSLRGNGKNTILKQQYFATDANDDAGNSLDNDGNFVGIAVTNGTDITIADLTIDGNSSNNVTFDGTVDNYLVYFKGITSALFKDMEIRNTPGGGLLITNSKRVSVENSTFVDGCLSDVDPFKPLDAQNSETVRINDNLFENYPGPVDLSVTSIVSTGGNIIRNCGTGLDAYATAKITTSNNIILGPSDEWVPSPDIYDSDWNSVNVSISTVSDFYGPRILYLEDNEPKDMSSGKVTVTARIGELVGLYNTTTTPSIGSTIIELQSGTIDDAADDIDREHGYYSLTLPQGTLDNSNDKGTWVLKDYKLTPLAYEAVATEYRVKPVGYASTVGIKTGYWTSDGTTEANVGTACTQYVVRLQTPSHFTGIATGHVCKIPGHSMSPDISGKAMKIAGKNNVNAENKQFVLSFAGISSYKSYTIPASSVNVNDQITLVGHGLTTRDGLTYIDASTTAITGIATNTEHYVIYVDDNTIKLADTPTLASAGTALNVTNIGAGNHRFANITAVSASNGGENGYISIRNTFTIFKGRVGVT